MIQTLKHIWRAYSSAERFAFVMAALLATASLALIAVLFFITSTAIVPAAGGGYTEAVVGQPTGVNPVLANNDPEKYLVALVFSPLGDFAEKIKPSPDLKEWDVRIKDGLTWQDGTPLTADDVIFTVLKIQDPSSRSPYASLWQGVTAERISSREIRFLLDAPYSFFDHTLSGLYPLPRHLFADIPPGNWRLSEYNFTPVGNGPYSFAGYDAKSDGFITSYLLRRDPSHSPPAFISEVTLKFYLSSEEAVGALNRGEVDGFAGLDPSDSGDLARPLDINAYPYSSYYAIFMNQSRNPALEDKSVRQVLSRSIDRVSLVRTVLGGHGVPSYGPILHADYSASMTPLSEDKSAGILENSGWHLNGQGFREKKIKSRTVPLALKLTVPAIPFLEKTAEAVKAEWQKLGIRTELESLPADRIAEERIANRNYEALLFGNILDPPQDLFPFWDSSQTAFPGLNLSSYSDKKADKLISDAREEADPAARMADAEKASEIIGEDYPAVFLYSPSYIYAANKNIKGIEIITLSDPADRARTIPKWYLETSRIFK